MLLLTRLFCALDRGACAQLEKLRQEKLLLQRHNKMLLLELSGQRQPRGGGGGGQVLSGEQASAAVEAVLTGTGSPDDVAASLTPPVEPPPPPPAAVELKALRVAHDELKTECRSMAKELSSLRKRVYDAELAQEKAEREAERVEVLRAQLMPLIASLKKDAVEESLWDNPFKLRQTASAAYQAGLPDHKVAHLITRANEIDAKEAHHARRGAVPAYAAAAGAADSHDSPYGGERASPKRESPKKAEGGGGGKGRRDTPTRLRSEVAASRAHEQKAKRAEKRAADAQEVAKAGSGQAAAKKGDGAPGIGGGGAAGGGNEPVRVRLEFGEDPALRVFVEPLDGRPLEVS